MSKQIQNHNDQNIARKIRLLLYGIVVLSFAYLFIRDLNPSGVLEIRYDLCKQSPYVSELSPQGRVLDIEKRDGYCVQRMVIDPVYVDVRLPQRYDTATLTMVYQKRDGQSLKAGPWVSVTEWQWALQPLGTVEESGDGWQTAVAEFDVRERPLDRRRLRFMLSSPGLAEREQEIVLREIRFRFEKPYFNQEMFARWVRSFLWQ